MVALLGAQMLFVQKQFEKRMPPDAIPIEVGRLVDATAIAAQGVGGVVIGP